VAEAFLWGLLAAATLLLGAFIAVTRPPRERVLGLIMGFGSGVLLSAVSFELVEEAVETSGSLRAATFGLFVGTAVFTGGDILVSRLGYANRKDIDAAPHEASGLTIVLGSLLDGVPECAVLGLTVLQTGEVSAAMLAAVLISNLPEGIAATTSLQSSRWTPSRIYLMWSVIVLACAVAAGAGFALLDGASGSTLAFILAFAGGAILTMLATSMMPEAYEHTGRAVGFVTVLGFSLAFAINWLEG
jgi:zinc transporter, ZIP family